MNWLGKPSNHVRTVETKPQVRIEKPFISMKEVNGEDFFELVVPSVTKGEAAIGPMVNGEFEDVRSFSKVKVCKPVLPLDKDGNYIEHDDSTYNILTKDDEMLTDNLQQALDEGKDLVLCPGIFFLSKPLIVRHPNQVILGLGLATLVAPQDGSPCIQVKPETPGVRIAGLVLEASLQKDSFTNESSSRSLDSQSRLSARSLTCRDCTTFDNGTTISSYQVKTRCLLEVGEDGKSDPGDEENPVLLADIFCRVGGSNLVRQKVETDIMIRIHTGNVVGKFFCYLIF